MRTTTLEWNKKVILKILECTLIEPPCEFAYAYTHNWNQTLLCGVPNGGTVENKYIEWYLNATKKDYEMERIMKFLKKIEILKEI